MRTVNLNYYLFDELGVEAKAYVIKTYMEREAYERACAMISQDFVDPLMECFSVFKSNLTYEIDAYDRMLINSGNLCDRIQLFLEDNTKADLKLKGNGYYATENCIDVWNAGIDEATKELREAFDSARELHGEDVYLDECVSSEVYGKFYRNIADLIKEIEVAANKLIDGELSEVYDLSEGSSWYEILHDEYMDQNVEFTEEGEMV